MNFVDLLKKNKLYLDALATVDSVQREKIDSFVKEFVSHISIDDTLINKLTSSLLNK